MKPMSPCKDCTDRDPINGCHDRCERYQNFKREQLEYNTQLVKIKKNDSYFEERKIRCAIQNRNKR